MFQWIKYIQIGRVVLGVVQDAMAAYEDGVITKEEIADIASKIVEKILPILGLRIK